jgi:hypothetical protein
MRSQKSGSDFYLKSNFVESSAHGPQFLEVKVFVFANKRATRYEYDLYPSVIVTKNH